MSIQSRTPTFLSKQQQQVKRNVLVFGDSLTSDLPLYDDLLTKFHIETHCGKGIDDFLMDDELEMGLGMILQEDVYDVVVICIGTNDLGHLQLDTQGLTQDLQAVFCKFSDRFISLLVSRLQQLHKIVHRSRSTAKIVCASLMHDGFNTVYRKACLQSPNIEFCYFLNEDINTNYLEDDGVHLSILGRKHFAQHIMKSIEKVSSFAPMSQIIDFLSCPDKSFYPFAHNYSGIPIPKCIRNDTRQLPKE
jgi:lysophospholipase L1-like esterase